MGSPVLWQSPAIWRGVLKWYRDITKPKTTLELYKVHWTMWRRSEGSETVTWITWCEVLVYGGGLWGSWPLLPSLPSVLLLAGRLLIASTCKEETRQHHTKPPTLLHPGGRIMILKTGVILRRGKVCATPLCQSGKYLDYKCYPYLCITCSPLLFSGSKIRYLLIVEY